MNCKKLPCRTLQLIVGNACEHLWELVGGAGVAVARVASLVFIFLRNDEFSFKFQSTKDIQTI